MEEKTIFFGAQDEGWRFDQFCKIIHEEFPEISWQFIELQIFKNPPFAGLWIRYSKPAPNNESMGALFLKSYTSMAEVLRTAECFFNFNPENLWLNWNKDGNLFLTDNKYCRPSG